MIEKVKDDVAEILAPSTEYLVEKRFTPDLLTMIGFIFNIGAAVLFGFGLYMWAGLTVLVAGIFDFLDGQVARKGKTESKFGALLDSTVDRYSEIFIWFGIAISFIRADDLWTSSAVFFALAGSLMVSYVRARIEGLGAECKVGFMQRPERIIAIGAGGVLAIVPLIGDIGLIVVVWAIALLGNFTAMERVIHFRKLTKS
ncbi:MAG: CDP-alcohol phosphatidyltransferase family protein [Gemmatimonadota bacterium]|nr:CDP-alcohol phosphatidyltransferase family protein [Gemmatimonadota bacterium]